MRKVGKGNMEHSGGGGKFFEIERPYLFPDVIHQIVNVHHFLETEGIHEISTTQILNIGLDAIACLAGDKVSPIECTGR